MTTIEHPMARIALRWLTAAEGGRSSGPPAAAVEATTCCFPSGDDGDSVMSILIQATPARPPRPGHRTDRLPRNPPRRAPPAARRHRPRPRRAAGRRRGGGPRPAGRPAMTVEVRVEVSDPTTWPVRDDCTFPVAATVVSFEAVRYPYQDSRTGTAAVSRLVTGPLDEVIGGSPTYQRVGVDDVFHPVNRLAALLFERRQVWDVAEAEGVVVPPEVRQQHRVVVDAHRGGSGISSCAPVGSRTPWNSRAAGRRYCSARSAATTPPMPTSTGWCRASPPATCNRTRSGRPRSTPSGPAGS